jgi:hypothetical protein
LQKFGGQPIEFPLSTGNPTMENPSSIIAAIKKALDVRIDITVRVAEISGEKGLEPNLWGKVTPASKTEL